MSKVILFSRLLEGLLYLRLLGKGLQLRAIILLAFILWLVKSLKSLWIVRLLITLRSVAFFWFPACFQVFSIKCNLLTVASDRIARAIYQIWVFSKCSTWYIQGCWSPPQALVLWNFKSGISNTGVINVKREGSALKEKSSFNPLMHNVPK